MTPTDKHHNHDLLAPLPEPCSPVNRTSMLPRRLVLHWPGRRGLASNCPGADVEAGVACDRRRDKLEPARPELAVGRQGSAAATRPKTACASMRELGALAYGPDRGRIAGFTLATGGARRSRRNRTLRSNGPALNLCQSPPARLRLRLRRRPALQLSSLGAPLVGRIWAGCGVRVRPWQLPAGPVQPLCSAVSCARQSKVTAGHPS